MPFQWLFDAAGGGPLAIAAVVIAVLATTMYLDLKGQVRELKESNKDLRSAIHRIADTIEAWTPEQQQGQQRRLKRP